ncbi:MAG: hypothetical protein JWN33_319 [Candidatus Saccharibacteria bacterium]|nr:hypothetical protein [Candidatus Saccharibacteria bacterium]
MYGKGATPSVAGVAVLPFTGGNEVLLTVAASLIALGVVVFVASLIMGRKSRQSEAN